MANLNDIAKRVGLSPSTVSRVLNHDVTMSVSRDNREAIFAVAAELDYMTPRGRRRGARAVDPDKVLERGAISIALVHFQVPDRELADPYHAAMRAGLEMASLRHRFHLIRTFPDQGRLSERVLFPASGAVVLGERPADEMRLCMEVYPKLVFLGAPPKYGAIGADSVAVDVLGASVRLIDDLLAQDYKRIGYVGWSESGVDPYDEPRAAALVGRLREREAFSAERFAIGENSDTAAITMTHRLMQLPEPPDVIIAATDRLAVGVYRAAFELGMAIPKDLAVVGYNDDPYSSLMGPSLTTIGIPSQMVGNAAIDLLAEQIDGRSTPKRVIFEGQIVWRESTRK